MSDGAVFVMLLFTVARRSRSFASVVTGVVDANVVGTFVSLLDDHCCL